MPIIDRAGNAPSIAFNAHLGRYLAVRCEVVSSTVLLSTSEHLCVEHPKLSSVDGTQIVIGYSRPTDPFRGDVRLARVVLR